MTVSVYIYALGRMPAVEYTQWVSISMAVGQGLGMVVSKNRSIRAEIEYLPGTRPFVKFYKC